MIGTDKKCPFRVDWAVVVPCKLLTARFRSSFGAVVICYRPLGRAADLELFRFRSFRSLFRISHLTIISTALEDLSYVGIRYSK